MLNAVFVVLDMKQIYIGLPTFQLLLLIDSDFIVNAAKHISVHLLRRFGWLGLHHVSGTLPPEFDVFLLCLITVQSPRIFLLIQVENGSSSVKENTSDFCSTTAQCKTGQTGVVGLSSQAFHMEMR